MPARSAFRCRRVFAHQDVAKQVAEGLAEVGKTLTVGDPTKPETDVGPLIRPAEVDRVHEWVQEAIEGGAELLAGGKKLSPSCYAPTVLFNPPVDAQVSTAEISGRLSASIPTLISMRQ